MEVLEQPDLEHIICWMPHGRAFLVKEPQPFVKEVLPRFFKQSKFMSFTRQLNLWGFKRLTRGIDNGAYYHPLFLRGRPLLCTKMKRQKLKGPTAKPSLNSDAEPNFYDTSRIRLLPTIAESNNKLWSMVQGSGNYNIMPMATMDARSYGAPAPSAPFHHPRQPNNMLAMHMDHGIFQPAPSLEPYPSMSMLSNSLYYSSSAHGLPMASSNQMPILRNATPAISNIGHIQHPNSSISWRSSGPQYMPTWPNANGPVYSSIPMSSMVRSERNHSQYLSSELRSPHQVALHSTADWATQEILQQRYQSRDATGRIIYR